MTHQLSYEVTSKSRCEIEIRHHLLDDKETLLKILNPLGSQIAIVTDDIIAPLHGKKLQETLSAAHLFSFSAGEQSKTRAVKEHLENQLFEKGLGRDTCLIALGGGVVTDLAGYIAATYGRGLPLIMIPTTLLGMVDASIGGKAGVNVPYGKNMIGSIYQPKKILIDPFILKTLPLNELRNGVVEMIKHGVIANAELFAFLEKQVQQILTLDSKTVEQVIFTNCKIKKEIVEQDEREGGKRHLLNFGHTVGHALERLMQYQISHGEAVAIGMLTEAHIAVQLGTLSQSSWNRLENLLKAYGLPLKLPKRFSTESLHEAMALDKKSLKGEARFVIIEEIGTPKSYNGAYCTHVEKNLINNALKWMTDALCSDHRTT